MEKKEEKQKDIYKLEQEKTAEIPEACKNCSNHPKNGGRGICHCILGLPKISY